MKNLTINAEASWTTTLFTAQNSQHASIKENLTRHHVCPRERGIDGGGERDRIVPAFNVVIHAQPA